MSPKKVVIIGAGIGGLATANILAEAGYDVHVYEKDSVPGGRAGQLKKDGFTFDTGPSWYLMPDVFSHYFDLLNEPIDKWLKLEKLTPAYKVFFENDQPIVVTGAIDTDSASFESIEPGAGEALKKYVKKSDEIYTLALNHFLYSNFQKITDLLHKDIIANMFTLPYLLARPIDSYVGSFVRDRRLKQILEYPMVFLGTSPFTAPAMYSLMSALDFKEGVFYPQGGLYTIIESLVTIGEKKGVSYHYDSETTKILTKNKVATGVFLKGGETIEADVVISNADLHYTETKLIEAHEQTYPDAYWQTKEAGPSALLMYLGVSGKIPEFEHHNLLFVDDWKANFDAMYVSKQLPDKASIYISKTSQTDPSVAPSDSENIFVLVPLPADIHLDETQVNQLVDKYLQQIEEMTKVNFVDRIIVKEIFKPNDFQTKYFSWQSSMLGQSHILKQSAFFRTKNVSKKVRNLYYVGGNTVPGIGLPMCLIGAELIYKRIVGDKFGGRVKDISTTSDRS